MCIVIVCYPVCDIMHFEIYLSFFIKPFFNTAKSSEQKLKYLKNEKVIYGEKKIIFRHFKRTVSCQKLSQTWECAFNNS